MLFERIRSVWLPTNGLLLATTLCTGSIAALATTWFLGGLGWLVLPSVGAWLLQLFVLISLRKVEEAIIGMPDDVRADRAAGPLGTLSVPAACVCLLLLGLAQVAAWRDVTADILMPTNARRLAMRAMSADHGRSRRQDRRVRRTRRRELPSHRETTAIEHPLVSGEAVDPLGYYRYTWHAPTDVCGTEPHADYDGKRAFTWGPRFRKQTAAECCAACVDHRQCNSWVFCPEPLCYSPDIWNHSFGECWLKQLVDPSAPPVNMRGEYTNRYRSRRGHGHAPPRVQWVSGTVKLSRGSRRTNGTWSSRAVW